VLFLVKRILTACVGIPLTLYLLYEGTWIFALYIVVLALLAWKEYAGMLAKNSIPGLFGGSGYLFAGLLVMSAWRYNDKYTLLLILVALFTCLFSVVLQNRSFSLLSAAYNFLGIIYIGLTFSYFVLLRFLPSGDGLTWFAIAMVGTWACDTFAYFIGMRWGKRKLCPSVSPKKSVEGSIAGLIGCIIVVSILGNLLGVNYKLSTIAGILIGIFSQIGDLVESALKRHMEVKDSGTLLPGHGGILDRLDSLMVVIPIIYYVAVMGFQL